MLEDHPSKRLRGFALLAQKDPDKRLAIARKGGRNVPAHKRSFKDPALAARAGRLGGRSVAPANRTFSKDRNMAAEAGRAGGKAPHKTRGRRRKDPAVITQPANEETTNGL